MTQLVPDVDRVLNPNLRMDAVTLLVGDLENMTSYYRTALALEPIEEIGHASGEVHRVLGRRGVPLVKFVATPDLPAVDPRQAGLFHTAFLFETEAELAATVMHAAQDPRSRFAGFSDHLVSKAFYFTDPEGNGIELYWDRPRDQWTWTNGEVAMDTLRLDPNEYLQTHLTQEAFDRAKTDAGIIGHVHLQVGDVARARDFYIDKLGFQVTVEGYPQALFSSAGGYHHHVAMNTWNSRGAAPRVASRGLGDVAIRVPGRDDLDSIAARLKRRGIDATDNGTSLTALDPWNTRVTFETEAPYTEELLAR
ncbi:VOC family protein [Parenemella sanctibonifatiensis]|nr:VOC family protein [Parenemella sanctibonifatiensis]